MSVPVAQFQSGPFNGPFCEASKLIDAVTAAPYEGVWVPAMFCKNLSLELNGTLSAANVDLYASNEFAEPASQYTITVGGTAAQGDILTTTFSCPNLAAGSKAVAYTVPATPTLTSIAAGIAAAINADTTLQGIGVSATSASAVVTVSYKNSYNDSSYVPSQAALANQVTLSTNVVGTETMTVATGTNGIKLTALTAVGFTQMTNNVRWIKARLTSFTGTNITVNFHGVG